MDPFASLMQDHRTVLGFLDTLLSDQTFSEEKHKILNTIIKEVTVHSMIEEMYVYPLMRKLISSGDTMTNENLDEHQIVKNILYRLDKWSSSASDRSTWNTFPYADIKLLRENLATHISKEESVEFPQMRSLMSQSQLDSLYNDLETGRKVSPTRPHPSAPDQPPLNKMVGAPTAMIDKMRDTTREFIDTK